MNKENRETESNVLELNVELSIELKSRNDFFQSCTAEEGIRNLEKFIYKTVDLITPKKSSKTKKDETGLPTKLKMLVPRSNVFGLIFCSPSHKKSQKNKTTYKTTKQKP